MGKLIALRAILFEARQYAAGDELPTKNPEMAKAWLEGGSAKRVSPEEPKEAEEPEESEETKKAETKKGAKK